MAGKLHTTVQEQIDDRQQRDHFPLQPRENQHEQASNQPPQVSYLPQQGGYQPPQASYSPQQGSYAPQQASYAPQQASYTPQQGGYPYQQTSYPLQQGYSPHQAGYPPWQASYHPQDAGYTPQQSTREFISQQPSVTENTDSVVFGETSVRAVCPHCRITVVTTTHSVPGLKACLCLPLCFTLFGCLVCCCLDDFMDVVHTCPFCKNKIATYEQPL